MSAEIPAKTEHKKRLREIIVKCNLHENCGSHGPGRKCYNPDTHCCRFRYPKPCPHETREAEDGYPIYRRRGRQKVKQVYYTPSAGRKLKYSVSDEWVVPYNPYLSWRYGCHINVEICSSVQACAYLFKYIMKGNDRITISLETGEPAGRDFTQEYIDARYMTANEAAWRLLKVFKMFYSSASVQKLPVHLDGDQWRVFKVPEVNSSPENLEEIEEDDEDPDPGDFTKLTEFFTLCRENPVETKDLKYINVYQEYWWNSSDREWVKRDKKPPKLTVGRMPIVSPKHGERFYLRMLLTAVCSPKGYDDIKGGKETFEDACYERGLLIDPKVWEYTMEDVALLGKPRCLRETFVCLLVNNGISKKHAGKLLTRFKSNLEG